MEQNLTGQGGQERQNSSTPIPAPSEINLES